MTDDEDRKAFEYKAGRGGYYLDRDPSNAERYAYASTQAAWAMWLAARDHYRQQAKELVEAGEKYRQEMCKCDDAGLRVRLNDLAALAAKLKEQHDG